MTTFEQELRFIQEMNVHRIKGLENWIERADPFSDDVERAISEIRRLKQENESISREISKVSGKEIRENMEQKLPEREIHGGAIRGINGHKRGKCCPPRAGNERSIIKHDACYDNQ